MSDMEIQSLRSEIDALRKEVLFNRDEFLRFVVTGFGGKSSGLMMRVKHIENLLLRNATPSVATTIKNFHDPRGVCVTEPFCEMCVAKRTGCAE